MSDLAWMRPRLAELCGGTVELYSGTAEYVGLACTVADWRPDEDVAQAVRCLETIREQEFWPEIKAANKGQWIVKLKHAIQRWGRGTDDILPRAICLAIAAALGWENKQENV